MVQNVALAESRGPQPLRGRSCLVLVGARAGLHGGGKGCQDVVGDQDQTLTGRAMGFGAEICCMISE